jgi:HSP20 family molecular chaperone IbpA
LITVAVNPSGATTAPAPEAPARVPKPGVEVSQRGVHTPLIDIHEGPDGLVLEADLPGVTENDVAIQLEDNVLSLHARVSSPAPEQARVLHEEYRLGDFVRSFILSDEVDRARIAAELKNGVLRLTLPRAERAKTRRIEIKA